MTHLGRPTTHVVGPAHLAGAAFDRADVALFVIAAENHAVVEANRAARHQLGLGRETQASVLARVPGHHQAGLAERISACLRTGQTTPVAADWWVDEDTRLAVELSLSPIERPDGDRIVALARVAGAAPQAAASAGQRHQILEMIARHLPLEQVLTGIETLIKNRFPAALTAIIVRDGDNVRIAGGEQLSPVYRANMRAAGASRNHPMGEALASGEPVIITDAATDERWGAALDAVATSGIRGLWIAPFADGPASTSAALTLHFPAAATPDDADLDGLHDAMQLGRLALAEHTTSRQLFQRAYFDGVTGLPNRRLLHDRLGQAIESARRHGELIAVVLLDLDEFKLVNDSLGHAIGDELLAAAASRLGASVGRADTVARLGGDEFAIVLAVDDTAAAAAAAARLRDALTGAIPLHGHRLSARASAGVALYPRDGDDAEALLQSAETAMYAAKQAGRNRYQFHSAQLNARVQERLGIESGLRRALEEGELRALYQPIVASGDGRVVTLEALLRWHHPADGLLPPDRFLAHAEASDLVCELDRWLWARAAADLEWLAGLGHRPKLSLNISPRDLQHSDFASRLVDMLAASGLPARRCELEITENVLMPDIAHARDQIQELKQRAPELMIVVDDFGTGYASLNYLRELPIDGLKIDRSFINTPDGQQGRASQAIARTIAELGRELGLCVTAEGIESRAQWALAHRIGCDRVQGFLFAGAMDRDALRQHLGAAADATRGAS